MKADGVSAVTSSCTMSIYAQIKLKGSDIESFALSLAEDEASPELVDKLEVVSPPELPGLGGEDVLVPVLHPHGGPGHGPAL